MLSSFKHGKTISIAVLILIVAVIAALYGYNKLVFSPQLSQYSSSLKAVETAKDFTKQAAAILLALPSRGNFNVNDTVNISLLVNTDNQPVNAITGSIIFPKDKLEMINTSKENSIITFWVQEPSLNGTGDAVTFSGVLPSPGFTGPVGQIINVSFKVKGEGTATIDVKDAQVLANDGLGTNILAEVVPANLTLMPLASPKNAADLNGDGKIDLIDVSTLIAHWGISKDSRFDLNKDGKVDIKDLSILMSKWAQNKK